MNYDPIINLERLSRLEPSQAFVRRTRRSLVKPKLVWFSFSKITVGALATATLALIAMIAPISFSNTGVAPALSADALNREFDNMSIAITLNKLQYDYSANRTIANAVLEITETKTSHLNGDVLKSEENTLGTTDTTSEQIDSLINEITR